MLPIQHLRGQGCPKCKLLNSKEVFIQKSIDFFGGIKTFEYNQKKDLIKKDFCNKNNIKLINIKYNEDIIEKLSEITKK